jgi:hypothetical protein
MKVLEGGSMQEFTGSISDVFPFSITACVSDAEVLSIPSPDPIF